MRIFGWICFWVLAVALWVIPVIGWFLSICMIVGAATNFRRPRWLWQMVGAPYTLPPRDKAHDAPEEPDAPKEKNEWCFGHDPVEGMLVPAGLILCCVVAWLVVMALGGWVVLP